MTQLSKSALRSSILARREALRPEEVEAKSEIILERILASSAYQNAQTIGIYLSVRNEVRTDPLIKLAWTDGKRICVPICEKKARRLLFSELRSFSQVGLGAYGLREPMAPHLHPVNPLSIDTLLVPGVAFTRQGDRLGHGAGYYDRFFARQKATAQTIALIYDFQLVADIPVEPHDIPVQHVVTECEWLPCREFTERQR